MNLDYKNLFGLLFLVCGVVLIAGSTFNITGAVISEGVAEWTGSLIGLIFVVIGLVVLVSYDLEKIIYKSADEKGNVCPFIADYEGLFTTDGRLKIDEFAKEVEKIGDDSELFGFVREIYVPLLLKIADKNNGEKSKLAKEFLNILGIKYEEDNSETRLSSEEKREIIDSFRDYKGGRMNKKQKRVLNNYDLRYINETPHSKLVNSEGRKIILPNTSGDKKRGGLNLASYIIGFIEGKKNQ